MARFACAGDWVFNPFCRFAGSLGTLTGLYVGANCGLDGQQLYDLPFQHYWHSESTVPAIPGRGYQMMQKPQSGTVNGLSIDVDTTMVDELGGVPQWWVKAG